MPDTKKWYVENFYDFFYSLKCISGLLNSGWCVNIVVCELVSVGWQLL